MEDKTFSLQLTKMMFYLLRQFLARKPPYLPKRKNSDILRINDFQ